MLIKKQLSNLSPYFVGLILLAMSLPLSKYTMGLFHFFLGLVWLLSDIQTSVQPTTSSKISHIKRLVISIPKNLFLKLQEISKNRIAIIAISIYLLFLTAFLWGGNTQYILTDLRVKLPLLILPLIVFSLKPLSSKQFQILLFTYVGAVIISTLFSANALFNNSFNDIRQISLFISPIRFALNICFSISLLSIYMTQNPQLKWRLKIPLLVFILWLIFILFKLESGIGLVILGALILLFGMRTIYLSSNVLLKIILGILLISGPTAVYFYLQHEVKSFYHTPEISFESLEHRTSSGNLYKHNTTDYPIEDGRFTGLYLCEEELKSSWEKRSSLKYEGKDFKNQNLKTTLIRYLSSKDLRKDESGVLSLTDADIAHIENGFANVNYIENSGLSTRISKILFAHEVYQKTADPNGSSLAQRKEYWSASINIIKDNFWLGIGSGNVTSGFDDQFNKNNSLLTKSNRMESHNQYLLIGLSFGIFGILWFMFALIYPAIKTRGFRYPDYTAFLIIIFISMLSEDTLETQAGVTFFAFFNTLFLSQYDDKLSSK